MLEILKQRRIWAAIMGGVALIVEIFFDGTVDAEQATNVTMNFIEAGAAMATVLLSIWSYIKPKKATKK